MKKEDDYDAWFNTKLVKSLEVVKPGATALTEVGIEVAQNIYLCIRAAVQSQRDSPERTRLGRAGCRNA